MSVLWAALALLISRLVHRPLLGRFGAGTVQHLVRLPGNLLHELAHAVVMLITGYTVAGLSVSLFDPSGRGHVQPGPAWTSLARPWLTNLFSPVAPAFVGLAALTGLHAWSGLPALPTSVDGVAPVLRAVPWASWQLWTALALGFSVTAEMAPSDVDLSVWWRPALVVGLLLVGLGWAMQRTDPGYLLTLATAVDPRLVGFTARALTLAVASGVTLGPVAALYGALRSAAS